MVGVRPPTWSRRRPLLVGELAVVAFLLFGYDRVAALSAVQPQVAVDHGRWLLAQEHVAGLDVERRLDLAVAAHRHLGQVLSLYYDLAHALVTFAVLAGAYIARRNYLRARRALLATNLVALVVFAVVPVAPPRLLPGAGFVDVVARSGTWGAWESASSGAAQHANVYASMPSLHVAWALWVVLAVWSAARRRALRVLAVAHLVATVGVVVVTGNHYLVDVAAGAALTALSWAVVTAMGARRPPAPAAPDEGREADRPQPVGAALAGLLPSTGPTGS
jgi:PAP2 superfamily